MKRLAIDWEKIFFGTLSDKGLGSKITENCDIINNEKKKSNSKLDKKKKKRKLIRDFNRKPETIKFLEESIGCKLLDIHLGNVCLFVMGLTSKAKAAKAKLNKWGQIKLKSFCKAKETINKMKRQSVEMGENICKSDKGQISKMCFFKKTYTT